MVGTTSLLLPLYQRDGIEKGKKKRKDSNPLTAGFLSFRVERGKRGGSEKEKEERGRRGPVSTPLSTSYSGRGGKREGKKKKGEERSPFPPPPPQGGGREKKEKRLLSSIFFL